jgi:hypothetical protein
VVGAGHRASAAATEWLSGYAKSGVSGGAAFEARGVISTQFALTPDGWRMASMIWDDERPGTTVPKTLLEKR